MSGSLLTRLPPIETPALWVRELVPSDVHDFAAYMLRDDYKRFLGVRHANVDQLRSFVLRNISRQSQGPRSSYHLAAVLKSCGASVADGFILTNNDGIAEIGWGVHPALWGKGLGLELAKALSALAFERLNMDSIWCKVMSENRPSLRVARKAGLLPWKTENEFPITGRRCARVELFRLKAQDYFEAAY
jgi:[ribosomal protein S5]-alanine N-acetyltransferase